MQVGQERCLVGNCLRTEPQSSGGHGAAWPSLVLSVLGDLAHPCQQGPEAQGDSNSWTSFWNSSRCS